MPVTLHAKGIRLAIRLTPKASKNGFGPVERAADGAAHLKAYVTTVPEAGKANKSLIRMLAKSCKLPGGKFSVASGLTNRNKQILIEGDAQELALKLNDWIKEITP